VIYPSIYADTGRVNTDPLADEAAFLAYYGIRPLSAELRPSLFHCRQCEGTGGDERVGQCRACRGKGLVRERTN
jgi:hypothetical protein